MQSRIALLDLAVESARLEEQNKAKRELRELLNGTAYEEKTAEIIDFIGAKSSRSEEQAGQKSTVHRSTSQIWERGWESNLSVTEA